MWLRREKILQYLQQQEIPVYKKEKIIKHNKYKIQMDIKKLSPSETNRLLFNSSLPLSAKQMIYNEIIYLAKDWKTESKEKYEQIKNDFANSNNIKDKLIRYEYCPNEFKKIIIDTLYGKDLKRMIKKQSYSTKAKKLMIELSLKYDDALELLGSNISFSLKEYIIKYHIKDEYDIRRCLKSELVPQDIKDRIIKEQVNMDNIFKVIWYDSYGTKDMVLTHKKQLLEDYIENISAKTILDEMIEKQLPADFVKVLYFEKKHIIEKAVLTCNNNTIERYITRNINQTPEIVSLIEQYRNHTLEKLIHELPKYEILNWLNQKYLSSKYKDLIKSIYKEQIDQEIKDLRVSTIVYTYITDKASLPMDIVEQIFETRKDEIINYIDLSSYDKVSRELKYSSLKLLVKKHIIQNHLTDKEVFKFLKEPYISQEIIDLVIETRDDIVKPYFDNLKLRNLITVKDDKLSYEVLYTLIKKNKDYVIEILHKQPPEKLYEYLSDYHVNNLIKVIILKLFKIDDEELQNCLDLISTNGNAELLLNNYTNIKDFITENNINFQSFLQYGSGSKKHSNWAIKIVNIIEKDKEQFKKYKDYFFQEYYNPNNNSVVYNISNFLELIDNYEKCKELCLYLTDNSIKLTPEDKVNISFIFNFNKSDEIKTPSNLEELSSFKMDVYDRYLEEFLDPDATIETLQDIFNELLFCNAHITLDCIGNSKALERLKQDNINSPELLEMIDELLLYSHIIEMVNDTNNIEGLSNILEYAFTDINFLTKFQTLFSKFEQKVTKVYELDSINNLTSLNEARKLKLLDQELSERYGGEVIDLSKTNYCLYGHILSRRENIEDLLEGKSTGTNNFISVSPISYRGQKYYYNNSEMIIAFDNILENSFVCSAVVNMGSNQNINNNSSEVEEIKRVQRGILQTSDVKRNNAEALLFREGLKTCGIILPGGKVPSERELDMHKKYNIPFIITQSVNSAIENPNFVFINDKVKNINFDPSDKEELEKIMSLVKPDVVIKKNTEEYTGREIALFTDSHSMYEPTLEVLEDIRRNGITEIYSLGDNVGLGPNPSEVFDLLEAYGVKSVAGNSEYYNTLGIEPFEYFYKEKQEIQEWTADKLGASRISKIKLFPPSIDLLVGNKKIALCHFANDCRWDFRDCSTHTYQAAFPSSHAAEQFLHTNSDETIKKLTKTILGHETESKMKGYISSLENPMFGGKLVTDYDSIIQGHVHFDMKDKLKNTDIYSLRAVGMGYEDDRDNTACYYVIKEKTDGTFDIEKRLVKFNRRNLLTNITTCGLPHKDILLRYVKG